MPRYPRAELPPGFALREFSDGTYQAYRESDPSQQSARVTRRLKAVEWCWLQIGKEAATTERERA